MNFSITKFLIINHLISKAEYVVIIIIFKYFPGQYYFWLGNQYIIIIVMLVNLFLDS